MQRFRGSSGNHAIPGGSAHADTLDLPQVQEFVQHLVDGRPRDVKLLRKGPGRSLFDGLHVGPHLELGGRQQVFEAVVRQQRHGQLGLPVDNVEEEFQPGDDGLVIGVEGVLAAAQGDVVVGLVVLDQLLVGDIGHVTVAGLEHRQVREDKREATIAVLEAMDLKHWTMRYVRLCMIV